MTLKARNLRFSLFVLLPLAWGLFRVAEQRPAASGRLAPRVDFNREIRPILSENCFFCHGPDESSRRAKLRFDTREGAFARPGVIVAGDAAASRLIERVASKDPAALMPPPDSGHKLTAAQIDLLRRWVNEGASWGQHWAFVAPRRPALPAVKSAAGRRWIRNPIDRFVMARLEAEGLAPAPEADRAQLLRRVSFDLTGLPPTPKELDDFLRDQSPNAYEKVVDRLLASPRYGERMAFRWLDAARYSDTHGYQRDGDRNMWRWRDWVIDAFNRNMPFDQFAIQQIAGDLLPPQADAEETLAQRIATGFNRNHRANSEGGIVPAEYFVEYVVDRVDTTSTVFMGLTAGCARCHNHKYDPLTQKEYYQLFAYFNSIPETGMIGDFGNARPWIAAPNGQQLRQLAALEDEIAQRKTRLAALAEQLAPAQREWERALSTAAPTQWFPADGLALAHSLDEGAGPDARKPYVTEPPKPAPAATPGTSGAAPAAKPTPQAVYGYVDGPPGHVPAPTGQGAAFDGRLVFNVEPNIRFGEVVRGRELKEKFAISVWVYPDAEQSGAIVTYLQDDPSTRESRLPRGRGFGLFFLDGRVQFNVVAGWDEDSVKTETRRAIPARQWHHLLATFDSENALGHIRIFVDGREEPLNVKQSSLFNTYFNNASRLRIGGGGGTALRFKGRLDELRIYKTLPDAAQIAILSCGDSLNRIAAIPPAERTEGQRLKIREAFFERGAPVEARQAREGLAESIRRRDALQASFPTVMVMQEMPAPRPTYLLKRGAYDAPGEKVARGVPAVLPPLSKEFSNDRLGLAKWLVGPDHPLTARVQVNRYWQMLFGAGLVRTVEDFGAQGEPPSHPELLDWLAVAFRDGTTKEERGTGNAGKSVPSSSLLIPRWNIKSLLKTIVMSATYRQTSRVTPALLQRDPQNRLLARGPRFRLSAEMLRDQALFVSGLLVEKLGGPSVNTYQPADVYKGMVFGSTTYTLEKGEGLWRRSLYTYWKRTILTPNMLLLDASAREFCTVRETRTNTPLQALTLMNDVTFVEAARMLAERMLTEGGADPASRLAWAFRLSISRPPSATELQVLQETLARQADHFRRNPAEAAKLLAVGEKRNTDKLDAAELAAYATMASLILNLNEAITRQ
ncbi:MAG: DUF1549 domain-containing protein [Blastocatellia bacterium]|nr:DUF1549 domain-containing protein [Blastocatellia bacterium]